MYEEKQYDEFKRRLHIDVARMDEELIEHPMLVQEVTEYAAEAARAEDMAKQAHDQIEARCATSIRADPDSGRLSNERVKEMVVLNTKVRKAYEAYLDAKTDLAYWRGLVGAFVAKGSSMKRFAELTIAGYLAPNTVRK